MKSQSKRGLAGRLARLLPILACLALLAPAASAWAQEACGGTNVTVTFPGNLTGSFAGVSLSTCPGGPGGYRSPLRMPPLARLGNALLSQGSFPAGQAFWQFNEAIRMNTIARGQVTVACTDGAGNSVTWVLLNACPTRISGVAPGGGAVRVDQLEITFENMTQGAQ